MFHNLKGYDAHFIIREVVPKRHGEITCIPKTGEQFISFSVGNMVFKDSYAFQSDSLDNLASSLSDDDKHHIKSLADAYAVDKNTAYDVFTKFATPSRKRKSKTKKSTSKRAKTDFTMDLEQSDDEEDQSPQMYSLETLPNDDYRKNPYSAPNLTPMQQQRSKELFSLMKRKGVYPYEYFTDFNKFNEQRLPPINDFYSSVTGSTITHKQYQFAESVFNNFEMKSLHDYHDLYLLMDVLILADVFTKFRKQCLVDYKLDPCHLYTSPGLAFESCLKMTNVELELITDPDQHKFLEQGIRGGISTISHRHAVADGDHWLSYVDANNLYAFGMSSYLPIDQFRWHQDPTSVDVMKIKDDADQGCILEVDIEYPQHLHDTHSEYPLAPEKMTVQEHMLSPVQLNMLKNLQETNTPKLKQKNNEKQTDKKIKFQTTEKLIPNLFNKTKYIVHYRNLKFYIQLGLKVTAIHRVLMFRQSPWLKKFIDYNTSKRMAATNSFEKAFYKLMNNSVFGKTMQNVRKERTITFVDSVKKADKLLSLPFYKKLYHYSR